MRPSRRHERRTWRPRVWASAASVCLSCGGLTEYPPARDHRPPDPGPFPTTPTTGRPRDTGPDETHDDTAVTTIDPVLEITVDPPAGTFSDWVTVTLTASEPDAVISYVLETSAATEPTVYTGPLVLSGSTTVKVMAAIPGYATAWEAHPYVALAADAVDFSSDIPILVFHTYGTAPTSTSSPQAGGTATVLEPDPKRANLLGAATTTTRAGLSVRGSSSSGHPKKPYTLELWEPEGTADHDIPWLGMPADADWVLYAPIVYDRALIRNSFAYEISREVGPYAPRTRMVEMFVADQGAPVSMAHYIGVYAVVERIERHDDRVDVAALAPEDIAWPEVSGGYIFKHDRLGPGEAGFVAGTGGGAFSMTLPMAYVYPDEWDLVPEQAAYLASALDEFAAALLAPDHRGPSTGLHYAELADVDSFIDHHIVNLMTKNPDAFRLSGYYSMDREGPLVAGPVWDFDRTMGCATDSRCDDPTWWDASNVTSDTTYMWDYGWYRGLFADPEFNEAYWARWEELLAGELSVASMSAIIDRMADELAEAAPRNFARWTDYPPRNGSFEGEIEIMRGWLAARHAWITVCIDTYADPRSCSG